MHQPIYEGCLKRMETSMIVIDHSHQVLQEAESCMRRSLAPFARPQGKDPNSDLFDTLIVRKASVTSPVLQPALS